MNKRGFGELELAVLHILEPGHKMSVKEVHQKLGGKDKYTTIMTVMVRLSEKGVIAREREGSHYEYWLLPAKGKISAFIDQFRKKIFGIKTTEMISYLIENEKDISDEEFAEMELMLERSRAKRKLKG